MEKTAAITSPTILKRLSSIGGFICTMKSHRIADTEITGRALIASQLGGFLGQAVFYLRSHLNETIQVSVGAWRYQVGISITFAQDYFDSIISDKISTKEVLWVEKERLYMRFIGFEGIGLHLRQFTTETGQSDSVSFGFHPLCYCQFDVSAGATLSSLTIKLTFANLNFESKVAYISPEQSVQEGVDCE
jgi:hypothetical protein